MCVMYNGPCGQGKTWHVASTPRPRGPCVSVAISLFTPHQIHCYDDFQGDYFLDLVHDLTFYASTRKKHLILPAFWTLHK